MVRPLVRPLIVLVTIGSLAGCATRRSATVGIVSGLVTVAAAGFLAAFSGPDDTPASRQTAVAFGSVALVGAGLVVAGIVGLIHPLGEKPERVVDLSAAGTCMPVAASSSIWACSAGYRCSDDFTACEPAAGRPTLRQR